MNKSVLPWHADVKPHMVLNGSKVCMVMAYAGDAKFTSMAEFASANNALYCKKHGYGFRAYTSGFDPSRHPSWSKLLFVRDALKHYSWVFWVDADAIVTNHDEKLERFMDNRYMMVVGKQNWNCEPWNSVNSGVFFVKRDPLFDRFALKVWDDIGRPGREGWEQDGVRHVMRGGLFSRNIKVVCRRDFNSVWFHESLGLHIGFNHETESWRKGDFMAHFGWRNPDVLGSMRLALLESGR